MEKIAVFLDENKKVSNFYDCEWIHIYEGRENTCAFVQEISFSKILPSSPRQIREETMKISGLIDGCSAAVFGGIAGVAYSVFDSRNFYIFTVEDGLKETIQGIYLDLKEFEAVVQKKKESQSALRPHEVEIPGVYYFDLLKAQKENPELTSKQVLKEFLDTAPFMELRLKGDHVPPWIERDGRFNIDKQPVGDYVHIIITKKQC